MTRAKPNSRNSELTAQILNDPMRYENLPKIYLYRRVVQATLFIDRNFEENIDAGEIADEACYSKFHYRQ